MKCCVVEPHYVGSMLVTFEGEGLKKVWLIGRRPCPEEATHEHTEDVVLKTDAGLVTNQLVFNTCSTHRRKT